jgi:acetyl-CoA carboxylase carboxyltransferase component
MSSETGDTKAALIDISDNHNFFELKPDYAKDMVTGFIRLNGMTVGAVANRTEVLDENGKVAERFDGSLTTEGCDKAAGFVNFCDAYQIPVLTLTNVNGYKASVEEEKTIAKASARLTYAFANATVPKVNVIVGKAFSSAYITMNSKHIGADMVFALPNAQIGMMEADLAAQIMYQGEDSSVLKEKAEEYAKLQSSAEAAARRGYVDNIIEPESVRKHVVYAFEMLFTKSESRPSKKHGSL